MQDPRHIWPWIAEGIRHLRPQLAVMENVPGHLTKGFGEVIGTLAEVGYDATWGCVRASDAGACHRRERVFIVATDADRVGRERVGGARDGGTGPAYRGGAADGGVKLLPTPTVNDSRGGRNITANRSAKKDTTSLGWTLTDVAFADRWGDYAPAIARWEHVLGRPAPAQADDKGRLAPRFVEWMMGLRLGHVTAIDLARSQQLKILGNGVVWQQAALALTHLLPIALTPSRQRTPA